MSFTGISTLTMELSSCYGRLWVKIDTTGHDMLSCYGQDRSQVEQRSALSAVRTSLCSYAANVTSWSAHGSCIECYA